MKLLLTEEESGRLAEAVKASGAPNRSFLILESIQTKLHSPNLPGLQGKRTTILHCWLPTEIIEEVRRLALERRVTQQSLLRYFLFTYLSQLPRKNTSPTKTRGHTRRGGSR